MRIQAPQSTLDDLQWYADQLDECQEAIDHYAAEGAYHLVTRWQQEFMRWEELADNYIAMTRDYIRVIAD